MQTYQKIKTINAHQDAVFDIAFANDTLYATASWDGYIKLWSVNQTEPLSYIRTEKAAAYAIRILSR